ncbi:hypothetical protein ZWY2020_013779 [Hordeum vulgare]|nr:hypothetical protein ZWY2020_013779 [Hordeum vulgare]
MAEGEGHVSALKKTPGHRTGGTDRRRRHDSRLPPPPLPPRETTRRASPARRDTQIASIRCTIDPPCRRRGASLDKVRILGI